MARRSPPWKVTYFEPGVPRLARNTIIESTFEVGRRFRCTMRVDCGRLDPGAVIRPDPGEWHPRMPERLDEEELADWRAGRDAIYQLAARSGPASPSPTYKPPAYGPRSAESPGQRLPSLVWKIHLLHGAHPGPMGRVADNRSRNPR